MKTSMVRPTIYVPEPRLFLWVTDGENFCQALSTLSAKAKSAGESSVSVAPHWLGRAWRAIRHVAGALVSFSSSARNFQSSPTGE